MLIGITDTSVLQHNLHAERHLEGRKRSSTDHIELMGKSGAQSKLIFWRGGGKRWPPATRRGEGCGNGVPSSQWASVAPGNFFLILHTNLYILVLFRVVCLIFGDGRNTVHPVFLLEGRSPPRPRDRRLWEKF